MKPPEKPPIAKRMFLHTDACFAVVVAVVVGIAVVLVVLVVVVVVVVQARRREWILQIIRQQTNEHTSKIKKRSCVFAQAMEIESYK